jgi:hypothetical protein
MVRDRRALLGFAFVMVILAVPYAYFAQRSPLQPQTDSSGVSRAMAPLEKLRLPFDYAEEGFIGLNLKVPLTEWTATKDLQATIARLDYQQL